jgi:hypothetical protein
MATAVRVLVAAVLGALTVALAAGCGTETVGVEQIASAADASERTSGMRVALKATIDVADREVPMSGSGVMDMRGRRAQLTYRVEGQEIHQVMDGLNMYMQSPQFEPVLEDGKTWAKMDLARANRELGIQQPGNSDPRQMLGQLKAVSGEVEKVGEEEVRGVETTHYRGEVDLRKTADDLPPARREAARRRIERFIDQFGVENYPMDVWIGEDDLVRRLRMRPSMELLGQEMSFDMTMDFFDYGTPVRVDLPPKDEVQDITDLASDSAQALAPGSTP